VLPERCHGCPPLKIVVASPGRIFVVVLLIRTISLMQREHTELANHDNKKNLGFHSHENRLGPIEINEKGNNFQEYSRSFLLQCCTEKEEKNSQVNPKNLWHLSKK
jgi:hypothetical protein